MPREREHTRAKLSAPFCTHAPPTWALTWAKTAKPRPLSPNTATLLPSPGASMMKNKRGGSCRVTKAKDRNYNEFSKIDQGPSNPPHKVSPQSERSFRVRVATLSQ